ncbi:uncharacterized protein LOC144548044 [Carex rostrata]
MCYFSPNFILLLLLIQAFLANCCIEQERDALLEFKAGVNDNSSRLASWRGEKCCNWAGIRCNNRTSRVVKLNLRNTNVEPIYYEGTIEYYLNYHPGLTGKISPSLLFLSDLKHLDLSFNNFSGNKFPEFISAFRNLKYLNLSNTGLSGMIHPQLGNLSKLLYFDLRQDYYFSGFMFSADTWWLSNMRSLKYIDMSGVDFKDSNNWVQSLNKLSSLEVLVLSDNNLIQIPNTLTLVNFTSLRVLHLSAQNINTTIPNWMGSLHSLNVLILKSCHMVGPYPATLGNLTNLVQLDLGYNYLNGTIPTNIGNLTNLVQLDLSDNNLNGTIPTDIGNLTNLVELDLSVNNLNGTIPTEIGNLTNLVKLDLSFNSLTGLLSETHLTGLSKLKDLNLRSNNMTILFGSEWTPSFQLNTIWLRSNKLGPKFPSWIQRQVLIEYLDLRDTGIDDCIPDWVWSLSSLRYLWLSTNILRGKLPASLLHMTKLELLDLSNNRLVGKIPFLPTSLVYLDLSNNSLSGQLRKHFKSPYKNKLIVSNNHIAEVVELFPCGLTSLGFLDLSSNSLSGHLPPCWSNISGLVKLTNNRFSGVVPSSLSCSVELEVVQLENNSLTGEFPFDLQFCKGLQLLDLGENNFHGIIPDWVGESFPYMAFLILRSNLFSGNIPSKLTQLNNLQVLDLANNYLSGQLPRGYQLQALDDPSIYSGNPYLCGPPLETSCGSSGRFPHNNGNNDSNSKNTGDRDKWLYLFIEFGFVVGFVVVYFILLFKVKWRYTYFQMVDTVFNRLYGLMLKPKLKWASAQ